MPLTVMAATTIEWSSFLHSTNSLCLSRQIKRLTAGKGITQASLEMQLHCVMSTFTNKSFKFCKIASVLHEIRPMLKKLAFFVDTV